jgi:predicted unusual protein kinase regulating ubiquinone biosynthesis (AarF/ABC1/UbiB family)
MKLLALPVTFTGRAAAAWGRRLAGADGERVTATAVQRNADQLFRVLGQLRGGAMKVGQALSVYDAMIPTEIEEPYRVALRRLQTTGSPMPIRDVRRVLDEQLGHGWRWRFRDFDDTPAASASIGQVHRAVWTDGRPVAVKVQYPGADLALDADLRTLQRFSRLLAMVVPGMDGRALMGELRARLLEELDYRAEADRQRAFAAAFAGHEALVVPAVVASAPKVIVSDWLEGVTLGALIEEPAVDAAEQARRDRHAHTVIETMLSSPTRLGLLHADPHPGNFMALDDGRLGMIDYGSVAALPGGIPPVLVRILRHIADSDPGAMMALLRAEGFVVGDVAADDVLRALGALGDPLRVERFHFHRGWTTGMGGHALETGRALTLPPRHLMVVRVLSGWMNILAQLDCTVDVRGVAQRWLPGFARRQAC